MSRSLALMLVSLIIAGCQRQPDNLRILTFNVGLLHAQADHPPVPPLLPACVSCDPFPVQYTGAPCSCLTITFQPNNRTFIDLPEAGDLDTRARRIALRLLNASKEHDIVVLNEVFHPAAKDEIVQILSVDFKHYVKTLAGMPPSGLLKLNDVMTNRIGVASEWGFVPFASFLGGYDAAPGESGLMLFSKYPFLPLEGDNVINEADPGGPACLNHPGVCKLEGANLPASHIAFDIYEDCDGTDCWASKGVGLVKIAAPGRPVYVAFTHMQADYPAEDAFFPQTRAMQYWNIRDVIRGAIPPDEIAKAQVLVAGDLNTPGHNYMKAQDRHTQEWHDTYNPDSNNPNFVNSFFACGGGASPSNITDCGSGFLGSEFLTDSWGFQTATSDTGITNFNDGARLDYLLHSHVDRLMCVQHVQIAWEQHDEDGWLSDHLPVRGDFLVRGGKSCSANDDPNYYNPFFQVEDLGFGPVACDDDPTDATNPDCDATRFLQNQELSRNGSMQWFRIEEAGTYSINHFPAEQNEPVTHVVYHHSDLSRPITAFKEDGLGDPPTGDTLKRGATYSMLYPPYYIRVYATDPTGETTRFGGNRKYSLLIQQHLCRSPVDSCVLDPALPYPYPWPTTDAGPPDDDPTTTGNPLTDRAEAWWQFKAAGIDGRNLAAPGDDDVRFPRIEMQMEAETLTRYGCITDSDASGHPKIEIYDDPANPVVLQSTEDFVDVVVDATDHDHDHDGSPDDFRLAPQLEGIDHPTIPQKGDFQIYFLKVKRDTDVHEPFNPCNPGMDMTITYRTSLTYFVPMQMRMAKELDDDPLAADQLWLYSGFDESAFVTSQPQINTVLMEFDEPEFFTPWRSLSPRLRGYYLGQVRFNLWEEDEAESLRPLDSGIFPLHGSIDSLHPFQVEFSNEKVYADAGNLDEADYWYELRYQLCHSHEWPACTNPSGQ